MRFRPSRAQTLALVPVLATLCALGIWQVRRHAESRRWLDRMEERTRQEPLTAADLCGAPPPAEEVDFRRLELSGRWDWDRWMVVSRQYRLSQPGYRLVVPFECGSAWMLVDRGWVPRDGFDASLAEARAREAETVTVRGVARDASEFAAPGEAAAPGAEDGRPRTWLRLAPAEMARAAGVPAPGWFVREGGRTEGAGAAPTAAWPASGWSVGYGGRPHLDYALTWFGLAAAALATWVGLGVQRGREAAPEPQAGSGYRAS